MRKCVALGGYLQGTPPGWPSPSKFPPFSIDDFIYPGGPSAGYPGGNTPSTEALYADTNTTWVRLWADWAMIQPIGADMVDQDLLNALDANIAYAQRYVTALGKQRRHAGVILTTYRFPGWAGGGTNSYSPPSNNVGVGSDYYYWLLFLASRYNPVFATQTAPVLPSDPRYANVPQPPAPFRAITYVDVLEFMNEPNSQWETPPAPPSVGANAASVAAEMFRTAIHVNEAPIGSSLPGLGGGTGLIIAGPAPSAQIDRTATSIDRFTDALLHKLKTQGIRPKHPGKFIWTMHNYDDVDGLRTAPPTPPNTKTPSEGGKLNKARPEATNAAALVRNKLVSYKWATYPNGSATSPEVWLTEGGLIRGKLKGGTASKRGPFVDREQERRLQFMWEQMRDENGLGKGISMFTQFLFYTAGFDSGLLELGPDGNGYGRLRPVYHTFKTLKTAKLNGPTSGWVLDKIGSPRSG